MSVASNKINLKMSKVASKLTDVGNELNKSGMGFEDIIDEDNGEDRRKLVDAFDVFDQNIKKVKM